jgi:gas vesicle protein
MKKDNNIYRKDIDQRNRIICGAIIGSIAGALTSKNKTSETIVGAMVGAI